MRLLSPGPGEILDRLAILKLKIERIPYGVESGHFKVERTKLERAYAVFAFPVAKTDVVNETIWELETLNREVWELIDLMHEKFYSASDGEIAQWAKRTMTLNDRRATLVNEINVAFGLGKHKEKI